MKQPAVNRVAIRAALACAAPLACVALVLASGQRVSSTLASVELSESRISADAAELHRLAALNLDPASLRRARTWLERQQADALEPALVIAELTAACRSVGADVEGIRPLDGARRSRPRPTAPARPTDPSAVSAAARSALAELEDSPPRYRITVRADYAMLGELMDACSRRRLPVRVTAVTVTPTDPPESRPFAALRAEITVETYRPPTGARATDAGHASAEPAFVASPLPAREVAR